VSGNSLDKLCHTRSLAYLVELVLLNKHHIPGGGNYVDARCYFPWILTETNDSCSLFSVKISKSQTMIEVVIRGYSRRQMSALQSPHPRSETATVRTNPNPNPIPKSNLSLTVSFTWRQ